MNMGITVKIAVFPGYEVYSCKGWDAPIDYSPFSERRRRAWLGESPYCLRNRVVK